MGLVRFIAGLSRRLRSGSSTSPDTGGDARHELGRRGEKCAARFLRRNGYKVLYRNYRARGGGEVDIVCRDRDTLVFVEVKTRSSAGYGNPAEAVRSAKQHLIARGALSWLRLLDNPDVFFRFDIVEVLAEEGGLRCNLLRDAFQLPPNFIY